MARVTTKEISYFDDSFPDAKNPFSGKGTKIVVAAVGDLVVISDTRTELAWFPKTKQYFEIDFDKDTRYVE